MKTVKPFFLLLLLFFISTDTIVRPISVVAESDCVKAAQLVKKGVDLQNGSAEEEGFYRDALSACPQMAEAFHNLGIIDLKNKKYDDAIHNLQKAVDAKDDAKFRITFGTIYAEKGDLLKSKEQYERALKLDPRSTKALQGISVVKALQGDMNGAFESLTKASLYDPKDPTTHFNLGAVYEKLGKYSEASKEYELVTQLAQNKFEGWYYLGLMQKKLDRIGDAKISLEKAQAIKPDEVKVHQALGVVYESLKNLDNAELSFRKAISLDPKDAVSQVDLGVVLLNKKQHSLAQETANKAIEIDPKNPKGYIVKGLAELQLGKPDVAEATFREALRFDATNAAVHYNLGVILLQLGRAKEADQEFNSAHQLDPSYLVPK